MQNKYKGCTLILAVLLLMTLLPGCSANRTNSSTTNQQAVTSTTPTQDTAATAIPNHTTTPTGQDSVTTSPSSNAITEERAKEIALEHAGFTADQVEQLRVEYEVDDRVPQYDVEFYVDQWEYEYEIHAESGDIISFDKDNKHD